MTQNGTGKNMTTGQGSTDRKCLSVPTGLKSLQKGVTFTNGGGPGKSDIIPMM